MYIFSLVSLKGNQHKILDKVPFVQQYISIVIICKNSTHKLIIYNIIHKKKLYYERVLGGRLWLSG